MLYDGDPCCNATWEKKSPPAAARRGGDFPPGGVGGYVFGLEGGGRYGSSIFATFCLHYLQSLFDQRCIHFIFSIRQLFCAMGKQMTTKVIEFEK